MKTYNPETDVCICFMTPNSNGRILSRAIGTRQTVQYSPACDETRGLPRSPSIQELQNDKIVRKQHALTSDPREVNCPDCQKTKAFKDAYVSQIGNLPEESPEPVVETTTTTPAPVLSTTTTQAPVDQE